MWKRGDGEGGGVRYGAESPRHRAAALLTIPLSWQV